MQKYHITTSGKPAVCIAPSGKCQYFRDEEHLTSLESAIKMNNFQMNVEQNGITAFSSLDIESLTKNELKLYLKILKSTFRELQITVQEKQFDENNPESALTQEEITQLHKDVKSYVENAYAEHWKKCEYYRNNFNFKPFRKGVPTGLLDGIEEKKAKKELCDYYLTDKNGQLETDKIKLLDKRIAGLPQSRLFSNFPHLLHEYGMIIEKNIENYQLAQWTKEDVYKRFDQDLVDTYKFKLSKHPKVTEAKSKAKRGVVSVSNDRKAILANVIREISIREQMEKFEGQPTIISRYNSSDMPDQEEQVLPFELKMKEKRKIANVFLMTKMNKLYKVLNITRDYIYVVDENGFEADLYTVNTITPADLTGNFTFFETSTDATEPYFLNTKFLYRIK